MSESPLHNALKLRAILWLYGNSCSIFAEELNCGYFGIADVAGVKPNGDGYYIEVKATSSDLKSRKQKRIYERTLDEHMIGKVNGFDFYYLMVPKPLVEETIKLYPRWGVIDHGQSVVHRTKRMPINKEQRSELPIALAHRVSMMHYRQLIYGTMIENYVYENF